MELTYKIYEHYKEEFALKRCSMLSINMVHTDFYFSQEGENVSLRGLGKLCRSNLSPKAIIKILRLMGRGNNG